MRITQGTFSFLPDLSDEQIRRQVQYCLDRGFAVNIEYTDDPHPRNTYWDMWNVPMFDVKDAVAVMEEIQACREAFPDRYVKVNAYDINRGRETVGLSFLVQRPAEEPGFGLVRQEVHGRTINYVLHSYATDRAPGARYNSGTVNGAAKQR